MKKELSYNGWNQFPIYSIKNFDEIRPQLLEEATQSAYAVAERFARTAKARLGDVKTLNQGVFSVRSKEDSTEENESGGGRKPSSYNKVVRVVVNVTYNLA